MISNIFISNLINFANIFLSGDGQAMAYLFVFAILVVAFLVVLTVPIIIVVLIGLLIALISIGILSTSVVSGLYQKSISQGFKTFVILISIVGCTVVSEFFFWLIHNVFGWWNINVSLVIGLIPGVLSGWFIGSVMFSTVKRIIKFIKNRYNK